MDAGGAQAVRVSVQTRADNFSAPTWCRSWPKAGFKHGGFGIETGVNRLARRIGKGERWSSTWSPSRSARTRLRRLLVHDLRPAHGDQPEREISYRAYEDAKVQASKYNNLIPYPGTPIYTDLKLTDRIHVEPGWANFNSTLSVTRSVFDKTPLPYVPETTSEFELKRDIIKYNMKTYVTLRAVMAILLERGPVVSPAGRWYLRPSELYSSRIAERMATWRVVRL